MTDQNLRREIAEALLARIKQAVVEPAMPWGGPIGSLLAATEYDLADTVLAVLAVRDAARQTTTHACDNCDGIDPDTCLNNPDRAARQTTGQTDTETRCSTCGHPIEPFYGTDWIHTAGSATGCLRATAPTTGQAGTETMPCICGHQEQRHVEDVCQDCGCGDYLEPADARDVIKRWRTAALEARAQLAAASAVGQPAEAHDTEARPPREQWRVEIFDPLAEEWAPGMSFPDRERAAQRLDEQAYSPRWGTDTPPRRRLVRETTTWTVEDETR